MHAAKPLNYAPRPSGRQSLVRWIYKWLWAAALLAATFLWGPGMLRWADYLYWERQCETYELPPSRVVFELTQGTFASDPIGKFTAEVARGTILEPEKCWPAIHFDPACDHATVFLHEMIRPDGRPRIVWLHLPSRWADPNSDQINLMCDQWDVSPRPQNLCTWDYVNFVKDFPDISDDHHWKIFAGQLDPGNPSHLTIDYDVDGHRQTCDGWLNNENELIVSQRP